MTDSERAQARARGRHPSQRGFQEHRLQAARKDYECDGRCGEPIRRGEVYDKLVSPAWKDAEGDVDDEGRTVAYLRPADERRWTTLRFHPGCYEHWMFG